MKNIDDIRDQFADVNDMPVSEELIGAYFEGTLDPSEMAMVNDYISDDDSFSDFIDDITLDDVYEVNQYSNVIDADYDAEYSDIYADADGDFYDDEYHPDVASDLYDDDFANDNHGLDDTSADDFGLDNYEDFDGNF